MKLNHVGISMYNGIIGYIFTGIPMKEMGKVIQLGLKRVYTLVNVSDLYNHKIHV